MIQIIAYGGLLFTSRFDSIEFQWFKLMVSNEKPHMHFDSV